MFSSETQPPPPPGPPCHNFIVSAITFEGFKLRSSNLTHALLIQISRTSSIIDIVVPSKMAAGGHFVKKKSKKSCVSIWNGQKCDRKLFADIRQRPFCQKFKKKIKFRINLKWPELRSKVNFGHPKWPIDLKWPELRSRNGHRQPFCKKNLYWSKIARNVIQSEFRTSKMADGSHFVKNFKKN